MLKIIIPAFLFSFSLPFIPEKYWLKFQSLLSFHSLKTAQELLKKLAEIEMELQTKGHLGLFELPQYKFHTALIERVLDFARRFGTPPRATLLEIREALGKDLQFERKIRKELFGGLAQFFLVGLVTWIFVFLSTRILDLKPALFTLTLMLTFQIFGIISYLLFFRVLRVRSFACFGKVFSSFYGLLVLSEAGLSVRQSLQESEILSVVSLKDQRFLFLFSRAKSLLERWQNKGTALKAELKELTYEAHQLEEEAFSFFIKGLTLLKFLILCLAFLSAYFIYLTSLFRVFLIE